MDNLKKICKNRGILIILIYYGFWKVLRRIRRYQLSLNIDPKMYTKNKTRLILTELHT